MIYIICSACQGCGEQGQQTHTVVCSACDGWGYVVYEFQDDEEERPLSSIKQFAFSLIQSSLSETVANAALPSHQS